MLHDLHSYIADARKKGFSYDDIALRLEAAGWNAILVEHAITKHKNIQDNTSVNSSIWFIVGIFVLVVAIVYGASWFGYGGSAEVFCVEPGYFGLVKENSFASCCTYVIPGNCQTGKTYTIQDKYGKVIFASNNYCKSPKGDVIIRGDVLVRC